MQEFTFNTGRHYSPEGQEIHVQVLETCHDEFGEFYRCKFVDRTRGVSGVVKVWEATPDQVLSAYDRGHYE